MEDPIFIARIWGPGLLVPGLWALFCPKNLKAYATCMKDCPAVFQYTSFLNILFGALMLNVTGNLWEFDWIAVVTILGWIYLLRGVGGFFLPGKTYKLTLGSKIFMTAYTLLFGALLSYYGYFLS